MQIWKKEEKRNHLYSCFKIKDYLQYFNLFTWLWSRLRPKHLVGSEHSQAWHLCRTHPRWEHIAKNRSWAPTDSNTQEARHCAQTSQQIPCHVWNPYSKCENKSRVINDTAQKACKRSRFRTRWLPIATRQSFLTTFIFLARKQNLFFFQIK